MFTNVHFSVDGCEHLWKYSCVTQRNARMKMTAQPRINKHNLRQLAWRNGYQGVTGVARAIGKSRVTVHRAVSNPNRFSPTMKKLTEVLL